MNDIPSLRNRIGRQEELPLLWPKLAELAPPRTRSDDARAILLLDAVDALVKARPENAPRLLSVLLDFFESVEPRDLPVSWLAEGALGDSGVIYTRSFDDVLDAPDLRAGCNQVARLVNTLRITSYFHEIMLEAISRDASADASCFLLGAAAVRRYQELPWDLGRGFLFCLVERARGSGLPALEWNPPLATTLPWERVWESLVNEGGGGLDAFRVATAERVLESAPLKAREIVASLGRRPEPWWQKLHPADVAEDAAAPLPSSRTVAPLSEDLRASLELGFDRAEAAIAKGEVGPPLALLGCLRASERIGDAALAIVSAPPGAIPR